MGVAEWRGYGMGGTALGEVRSPSPKGRKPKATIAALDHLILFHCGARLKNH